MKSFFPKPQICSFYSNNKVVCNCWCSSRGQKWKSVYLKLLCNCFSQLLKNSRKVLSVKSCLAYLLTISSGVTSAYVVRNFIYSVKESKKKCYMFRTSLDAEELPIFVLKKKKNIFCSSFLEIN